MNRSNIFALIAFSVIVGWHPAQADSPFCVEITMDPSKIPTCKQFNAKDETVRFFQCSKLLKTHDDFMSFAIAYVDHVGVCMITANSIYFPADDDGTKTNAEFRKIMKQLDDKYGHSNDMSGTGNELSDQQRTKIMHYIFSEEYRFILSWNDLNKDFPSIQLSEAASNESTGYISLVYYSRLHQACKDASDKANKSSL